MASRPSKLVRISRDLCREVSGLKFGSPVAYVYNPLEYARTPHEQYLERFGRGEKRRALFLGMNPGPFGMAQTGVPFGDVTMVRSYLGIEGAIGKPEKECSARPIRGFACTRSEVSGTRFWGMLRDVYPKAADFFVDHFVANWCPLVFMEEGGRNVTPDKLAKEECEPLFRACDRALERTFDALEPDWVIGVGTFAEKRARKAIPKAKTASILHPSPASPLANRAWPDGVRAQLASFGLPEFARSAQG